MARCAFCGGSRDDAWLLLAGPEASVCDACIADLGDMARPEDEPGQSADLFGPCRFCGSGPPDARLIVGSVEHGEGPPVICTQCVRLGVDVVGEHLDLDGPWYRPLRFEGGHGVGPAGPDPEGVDALLARARDRSAEIDAWAEHRLAELRALGLPAGPDIAPIVRRKAIGVLLGDLGVERGRRIPYDVAIAIAERLV